MARILRLLLTGSLLLLPLISYGQSTVLPDNRLRFDYISQDGQIHYPCTHKRIRDLPDWEVVCKSTNGIVRTFAAHVVVVRGQRQPQSGPGIWYEILYWVTDRQDKNKPVFHSSSMTFNLTPTSHLQAFRIFQGVENDYAALVLTVML